MAPTLGVTANVTYLDRKILKRRTLCTGARENRPPGHGQNYYCHPSAFQGLYLTNIQIAEDQWDDDMPGTLVVTRLDRLARSTADLLRIIDLLENKGVGLRILDFGGSEVDTRSPTGRLTVTIFGALGQWERELMIARQREGIERAKREGKYKGRAPTARRRLPEMRKLAGEGLSPPEIADRVNCSRASVYRLLKEDAS